MVTELPAHSHGMTEDKDTTMSNARLMKSLVAAAILGLAHSGAQAAPQGPAVAAAITNNASHKLAIELVQLSPQAQRNRDNRRNLGTAIGIGLAAGALGAALGGGAAAQPVYQERRPHWVDEEDDYYVDTRRPFRPVHRPVYIEPQRYRPVRGGGAVEYCLSRFRSYDPRTGTYIDFNGRERSCP
jgi:BA14K-like protein